MISPLFSFRTIIYGVGDTPLHVACWKNREEIAIFLISKERERVRQEREEGRGRQGGAGGGRGTLPSYNMKSSFGTRPVFYTDSARIVEELLTFEDLEVTNGNGKPLLWRCAEWGIVTEIVARDVKLASQYSQRYDGTLPLEKGERALGVVQGMKLLYNFADLN